MCKIKYLLHVQIHRFLELLLEYRISSYKYVTDPCASLARVEEQQIKKRAAAAYTLAVMKNKRLSGSRER